MAEAYLGEDVLNVSLDGDILVDHGDLLGIQCELSLVNIDSLPKFVDSLFDFRTNLSDGCHFSHWSLHAVSSRIHFVELLDTLVIRCLFSVVHTSVNFAQIGRLLILSPIVIIVSVG